MSLVLSLLMLFGTLEETITVTKMPAPTPEIKKLLADLGDNNFLVRERATAELQKKGYEALRGLELAEQSGDPEVVSRSRRLLENYYNLNRPKQMPGIMRIPQEGATLTYKGGKYVIPGALRKELYMAFWYEAHPDYMGNPWFEAEVSDQAMKVILKKMLRQGVPKATIEEWLKGLAAADTDWQPGDFDGYEGNE